MQALIQLGIFATLLTLGYVFGRLAETRHYRSIRQREDEYRNIVVTTDRIPDPSYMSGDSELVAGSVVVSVDYFKLVAAGLRGLIGGRLRAYESLLDRARREAILRMQQEAVNKGASLVINMKFETSQISSQAANGIGSIEVLAYGTALKLNQ